MKTLISFILLPGLLCISFLGGCKKFGGDANNCELIQKVKITNAKPIYHVGDSIELGSTFVPIGLFIWSHEGTPNSISSEATVLVYPCTKYDEGWYYLAVSYPECASGFDSVYLSVINKPVPAPCNPANNTVSFSSIPNITSSSTSWSLDPNFGCKLLYGYYAAGYPDLSIYFNFYWNATEPEDGEYNISNTVTFDDNDPYSVFIASNYSSVYFEADPGKVYVSHVNGKLGVTFCGLPLSGDLGGISYNTTATGNLTAP